MAKRQIIGVATRQGALPIKGYRFEHLALHRPFNVSEDEHGRPVVHLKDDGWILTHRGTGRRVTYLDGPFSDALKRALWAEEHGDKLWPKLTTGELKKDKAVLATIKERILPVLQSTRDAEGAIATHG